MRHVVSWPVALTIAGSDSGGGAGIQVDLKTFAALGVHGTTAITCLTAQNPRGVRAIQAARPSMVRDQIEAVFEELPPRAVKTGMLYSAAVIRTVAGVLCERPQVPLVVDPVMAATSGACLLQPSAVRALVTEMLPRATLITPNLDEAALLLERPLRRLEDLRSAARELRSRFGAAVLLKGGHLKGMTRAVDLYVDGTVELLLEAPFVRGIATHGTGCTYAAAITAYLAHGFPLPRAVEMAKTYITGAIARHVRAGLHSVLHCLWQTRRRS